MGPDEIAQETAAILMGLDLTITADTALAHLAGALGARVWVILQAVPDCAGSPGVTTVRGTPRCACSASVRRVTGRRSSSGWRPSSPRWPGSHEHRLVARPSSPVASLWRAIQGCSAAQL
jgi:hypothetical protein